MSTKLNLNFTPIKIVTVVYRRILRDKSTTRLDEWLPEFNRAYALQTPPR